MALLAGDALQALAPRRRLSTGMDRAENDAATALACWPEATA